MHVSGVGTKQQQTNLHRFKIMEIIQALSNFNSQFPLAKNEFPITSKN